MESLVASSEESAVRGMEEFLKAFSFVPEEKLNWTPSPTARTAIRIAAHTALTAGGLVARADVTCVSLTAVRSGVAFALASTPRLGCTGNEAS